MASVREYIEHACRNGKRLHMTLIDPASQPPELAAEIAHAAENAGSNAIMVGGSTGVTRENADATIGAIKAAVKLPVIIFPTSAAMLTPRADAIFFMSMLNSRKLELVIGEQVRGAAAVKKLGLEPLPMGYVIVAPGMTVGKVGAAELITRDARGAELAVRYALAAQYLGMGLFYLEAGSGAPEPVPPEMIRAVKRECTLPLAVGGGLTTPELVDAVLAAGADIIVTGTLVENVRVEDAAAALRGMVAVCRKHSRSPNPQ